MHAHTLRLNNYSHLCEAHVSVLYPLNNATLGEDSVLLLLSNTTGK